MCHEHVGDFLRGNLFSATIDHLLEATGEKQVALMVEHTLVSRSEPSSGKGLRVGRRICLIALENIGTTNDHLTRHSGGQHRARLVHNRYLRTRGNSYRTRFTQLGWERVAGDLDSSLRHPIRYNHWCTE